MADSRRRATSRAGAGAGAGAGHRKRRARKRARIVAATAVSFLVLVIAGCGLVYLKFNGSINTFDNDGVSKKRPPSGESGKNVLVIGSDSRSGKNKKLGGGEGDIGRADTAFLLHVYADHKHAIAVSIPRDTLVDIPSCRLPDGTWTKPQDNTIFNSAFSVGKTAQGNPACTQNTVEKLTGLRVDHTAVVDFEGFSKMTSAVGGVPVCLPKPVYQGDLNPNRNSRGALLFPKGPQQVSGQQALDYVRIRHGIGDGSDIGRIQRQQAFVGSLLKKIKKKGMNPSTLMPLAKSVTDSMTVDSGLDSATKMLSFAMSLKNIDLDNTKFVTVPWHYQGARVALNRSKADALWEDLKHDRTVDGKDASGGKKDADSPSSASPSPSVSAASGSKVAVYNTTSITGLGSRTARTLTSAGFTVTTVANKESTGQDHTVIEYAPGKKAEARAVSRLFPHATLRATAPSGVRVLAGSDAASTTDKDPAPTHTSSDTQDHSRSADDNPCSGLSYG